MMKRKVLRFLGALFISAGLLLILASLIFNLLQNIKRQKAIAEFKRELAVEKGVSFSEESLNKASDVTEKALFKDDGSDLWETDPEGKVIGILRIPSIESESPIREGVSQSVLADSLGHEPDTAAIGEIGNCVIAGHRNYSFGKFFSFLDKVKIEDMIYVDTLDDTCSYEVFDIKVVEPDDLSVLCDTEEEVITLYTCTPKYIGTHRLVVSAKRVE